MPYVSARTETAAPRFRRSRVTWLVVVLAGLGVVVNIGFAIHAVGEPSDGWTLQPRAEGLVFFGPRDAEAGAASPIRQGDVLVAVGGRTTPELLAQAMRGDTSAPSGWRAGGGVAYTALRDGTELMLDVPLVALPWSAWFEPPGSATAPLPLRIAVPLLGLYVLLRRPGETAARLFFVFTYAAFLGLPGSLYAARPLHQVAEPFAPGLFWPAFGLQEVGFVLSFTVLLHLFLVFPRRTHFANVALPMLYLAYPALTVVNVVAAWGIPPRSGGARSRCSPMPGRSRWPSACWLPPSTASAAPRTAWPANKRAGSCGAVDWLSHPCWCSERSASFFPAPTALSTGPSPPRALASSRPASPWPFSATASGTSTWCCVERWLLLGAGVALRVLQQFAGVRSSKGASELPDRFVAADGLEELTPRESEVLRLIAQGRRNREIAEKAGD